ncbi:MAG: shikimate dehydrogenase [Rhodospirillaceae bacterium]|nr:shikimate dehydrogenase [Rhodospirillaceae bacterium]
MTGQAKVAGVVGWPVAQSLSPSLHGYWLQQYGINGSYIPLAVRPEDLAESLQTLPKLGFVGANLTVPHKEAAVEIVDKIDDTAARIGAVNTIVISDDGLIEGRNTDGFGFIAALSAATDLSTAKNEPAVVIGAGGAARAVVTSLLDYGVSSIRLVNRTYERAEALRDEMGDKIEPVRWAECSDALSGAKLLVNTTTLGMVGNPPLKIPLDDLSPTAIVNDIVYSPLMTNLLKNANERGNPIVDGLNMLLHQARPGFAAWFDKEPEVTDALRSHILDQKEA